VTHLIVYDRSMQKTTLYEQYTDEEEGSARERRLSLELEARRLGNDVEVVVLQAQNEEALRKTHARYFETLTLDDFKNELTAALAKASSADAA
jgi:hypothetical protein